MISTHKLTKTYAQGGIETRVLKSIDLDIKTGEFVAIMGRSGAGKSTLLYQMSLLDKPTSGKVLIDGIDVTTLPEGERTLFRLLNLGYVFQDYALIPDLTAKENVALPLLMQGMSTHAAYKKAKEVLTEIGLPEKLDFLPSKLSGGQQQRVSIARALAHNPKILFADEPTANLDSESGALVIELFREINKKGQTVVMVTHEEEYGKKADRIIRLSDGEVVV